MGDLLHAVQAMTHALLFPTPFITQSSSFMFLSHLLQKQFERTGSLEDIDQAIILNEAVLKATPPNDKYLIKCQASLAVALKMRFDVCGSVEDLNQALSNIKTVTRSYNRKSLPKSYFCRLKELWNGESAVNSTDDVDLVVASNQQAIMDLNGLHPYSDPGAPVYLEFSELALRLEFEKNISSENVQKLVALWEEAVASTPQSHLNYARYIRRLSSALLLRFEVIGEKDDLARALCLSEQALAFGISEWRRKSPGLYLGIWSCTVVKIPNHRFNM